MRKKELFAQVLDFFERTMDATETELDFRNNFELVVAVVLSAQCTDKRINQVTPRLFQDFPTPEAMAQTTSEVIFDYIKSVSYPNNKAKHLVGLAKWLLLTIGCFSTVAILALQENRFATNVDWRTCVHRLVSF